MLKAVADAGVRRFVHLGAMGVVDDPDLHYGSSKAKAMALVRESGLDWTILKPSLLFGPRDGFFNLLLAGLVRMSPGIVPITGSGQARFQPLAIGDLARVFVVVVGDQGTIGREYELGGPRIWTYREIVEEVAGHGSRRLLVPMPVAVIRLVAGAAQRVHLPFPVATDQLRQLRFDNTGSLDSVSAAFGFEPAQMEGGLTHLRRRVKDQEPDAA